VAQQLQQLGEPLVGIEDVDSPLVRELMEADMPVILGDIREDSVLRKANLAAAKAVIICTNNDRVNLRAAFRVRELHPDAPIVLRLFDDELSAEIHTHLALDAILSRSAIAALSLAHAAVGVEVLESFSLHGQEYALARLPLGQACSLVGCTVARLEEWRDVRLVGLSRGEQLLLEPAGAEPLQEEDVLLVFAATPRLMALVQVGAGEALPPVLVCGLGHTGYRVALALRELGQEVVALVEEDSPLAARLERHGVAVRRGDWGDAEMLRAAGVERAAAIVLCAEDDMLNLETALRARRLNPGVRVVLRAFYEDWGEQLRRAFGFQAVYSTSAIAAPHFVAAALRRLHVASDPIRVGGQELYPARIKVEPASFLLNRTIADLDRESGLMVLLHRHEEQMQLPPQPQARLCWGDEVVVLATTARLRALNLANDPHAEP
jgi:Trk K+ transport system NAD-binding subunit